ncbi:hypothetical protein EJ05DRAFT_458195 [Pseudovirgaria hyperparasitica]|uniref:RBR-type E3 ubiquitin transferase n=1 Tax=Pseudovirgaria hyperparasitica TaxID=470096 RepID=A0A6A6VUD7_9PEZI|nr:uncharacterized protein EJ05DRAFT_458195 [Pseudovirgaria hyperparasitica]KAF2753230.1 hypothetical protein EJ05DRAFT_458195 [Pseudovirgaria hyperparasitica]
MARLGKGKGKAQEIVRHECSSCGESFHHFDVIRLSCQPEPHNYCRDCLRGMFEASMTDSGLFPPRCCKGHIPLSSVQDFFTRDFLAEFEIRRIELSTPNPTYCSEELCHRFIPPDRIQASVGTCRGCNRKTCAVCKSPQHDGLCPEDKDTKSLLSTAQEKEWQQCLKCRHMVAIDAGCNHIECPCGAQFCYECGKVWKTCQCDHARVDRIIYTDPNSRSGNVRAREAPVWPSPLQLDCEHRPNGGRFDRYFAVNGKDFIECRGCHSLFRRYIFECQDCNLRACLNCLRHRF